VSQSLSTSAISAGNLLSGSRFQVPEYQREYAWGLTEVREFWRDLQGAVADPEYFLGLLIFTKDDEARFVVDGQQRLITLTLLSRAIQLAAESLGRRALAERIESMMLFALDYSTDVSGPRIVLTDRHDNATLKTLLGSEVQPKSKSSSSDTDSEDLDSDFDEEASVSEKMVASFDYLLRELAIDLAAHDPFARIGQWAEFVLDKLYFAVFVHPSKSAAYKVFEVVNTRGRQLTTAELVKSYVLSRSSELNRASRFDRWVLISDAFRTTGYQSQFAQYIRHVVTKHHGYVLPRDLYEFVSKAYQDDSGVSNLVGQLESDLPLYLQMMDPTLAGPASPEELGVFSAMNLLDLRGVRPLLLATHDTDDAPTGAQELLKLAVKRVVVGNFGTGSIERLFSEAAKLTHKGADWRVGLASLSELEPQKSEFRRKLASRSYNKSVLFYLRSAIQQSSVIPELKGSLHFIRIRNASDWSSMTDDEFKAIGSIIGNTFIATLDRRPKGSSTPSGFETLLLPFAVEREDLSAEELGSFGAPDLKRISSRLASAGANLWYR